MSGLSTNSGPFCACGCGQEVDPDNPLSCITDIGYRFDPWDSQGIPYMRYWKHEHYERPEANQRLQSQPVSA